MEKFYKHFDSIESTQQWAKENLGSLPKEGITLIWTEEQSKGYGQQKRPWVAPKGEGLWATFCFFQENPDGFIITRHMALCLIELLQEEGVHAVVKRPNDIFVEGKKMAGILTEIVGDWVVVGVGWNVNMPEESIAKIDQPATSLMVLTGRTFVSKELLDRLATLFGKFK